MLDEIGAAMAFQLGHFFAEMDRFVSLWDGTVCIAEFQLGHFFAEMDREC